MSRHRREPGAVEDEASASVPTFSEATPTIDTKRSPFHLRPGLGQTVPGMPALVPLDPKISEVEPDLAGPTAPDGHLIPWEGTTDPEIGLPWIDAGPTEPTAALPRVLPIVPPPGSPTFEISKSLQIASLRATPAPTEPAAKGPARRKMARHHRHQEGPGPSAATVVLPALKRKPAREGSDWVLTLAVIALFFVIAALLGAVGWGVIRSMEARRAAPAAAAP